MTLSQIGFHFVGPFAESNCREYFDLLNKTRPACITVKGAEQYPQALEFAKTCVNVYPGIRTIFRHMIPGYNFPGEDTGRWTKVSAKDWWLYIGKSYINTGLTILLSNEDTMDDYSLYDGWTSEAMTRAGDEGVAVAYLRFPTHHPRPGKQSQFDRTLKAAFKYGKLHSFSPNVYWDAMNSDGFKFPYYVIDYAKKLGIDLDTTIGEFALLRDIRDAYKGWRSCNVSSKVYALDAVIKAKVHLPGIPVCAFSIGQWPIGADTFSLDKDALDTIKANLTPLDKPVAPAPTNVGVDPPAPGIPPVTPTVPLPPAPNIPDSSQPPQTPPPLPVEPPPVISEPEPEKQPMTSVPTELLMLWREDYGKRANGLRDTIRGLSQQAATLEDWISQIDMYLSKKIA